MKRKIVIGALANVDAGKTTLAEGLLYKTNTIRKKGRVDHKDAFLDFNRLEKEKGITIFNKEARFNYKDTEFIYIDTPGHKELENERNRSLNILDGVILLISAIDKNFENSKELFEILDKRNIPIFIFINKIDISYSSNEELIKTLQKEISPNCIDVSEIEELINEGLIENIDDALIKHEIIPIICGSALKDINLDKLLDTLNKYIKNKACSDLLNAYIYRKDKMAYVKILSGTLKTKMAFDNDNKINEMYSINGNNLKVINEAYQNDIVAIKGLNNYKVGTYLPSLINDLEIKEENTKLLICDKDPYNVYKQISVLNDKMPELNIKLIKNDLFINIDGPLKEEIVKKLIKEDSNLDVSFVLPSNEEIIEEEIILEEKEESHYTYKQENISEEELKRVFNSIYKPKERPLYKKEEKKEEKETTYIKPKDLLYMIDGYNLMHALDDYKDEDFTILRDKVIEMVCDFQGYVNASCILVFDAYKNDETCTRINRYDNITIIYTKNKQTADEYIEIKSKELKDDYKVIVVTSDYLEQIRVFSNGASRLSSREFIERYNNFKKEKHKIDYKPNKPLSELRKLLEEE